MEHTTTKDQKDDEKQPDISNDTLNDSPKSDDKGVISSPKQTSPNVSGFYCSGVLVIFNIDGWDLDKGICLYITAYFIVTDL